MSVCSALLIKEIVVDPAVCKTASAVVVAKMNVQKLSIMLFLGLSTKVGTGPERLL